MFRLCMWRASGERVMKGEVQRKVEVWGREVEVVDWGFWQREKVKEQSFERGGGVISFKDIREVVFSEIGNVQFWGDVELVWVECGFLLCLLVGFFGIVQVVGWSLVAGFSFTFQNLFWDFGFFEGFGGGESGLERSLG